MEIEFKELTEDIGLKLTEYQMKQFDLYYQLLIEWNDKINLTAITEKDAVYKKHFYDSLCFIKAFSPSKEQLLDVGSGAGFPSIPLLIAFPDLKVTIIDAQLKRIKFLEILTTKLNVNVKLIHGRAEEFTFKNHFDLVTARAVSNLPMLAELCLPFARVGGHFIALKGPGYKKEVTESENAFSLLGGKLKDIVTYQFENQDRSLIIVEKTEKTNSSYPRKFGQIKKNPL